MTMQKYFLLLVYTFCFISACQDTNTPEASILPFKEGSSWGLMSAKGKVLLPASFDTIGVSGADRFVFYKKGKCGYLDNKGQIVIDSIFCGCGSFSESVAKTYIRSPDNVLFACIIDTLGNMLYKTLEDNFDPWMTAGLFSCGSDASNAYYMDKYGVVQLRTNFPYASSFDNICAVVWGRGDTSCLIDRTGKIRRFYVGDNYIGFPAGGVVQIRGNNYTTFVSTTDFSELFSLQEEAGTIYFNFSEGRCLFKQGNEFGYIDINGRVIIKPLYEAGQGFSEGLVAVRLNGKYGFVDKSGKVVIPFRYEQILNGFQRGFALVLLGQKPIWINRHGRPIYPET